MGSIYKRLQNGGHIKGVSLPYGNKKPNNTAAFNRYKTQMPPRVDQPTFADSLHLYNIQQQWFDEMSKNPFGEQYREISKNVHASDLTDEHDNIINSFIEWNEKQGKDPITQMQEKAGNLTLRGITPLYSDGTPADKPREYLERMGYLEKEIPSFPKPKKAPWKKENIAKLHSASAGQLSVSDTLSGIDLSRQYKEEDGKYFMRFNQSEDPRGIEWRPITKESYRLGMKKSDAQGFRKGYADGGDVKKGHTGINLLPEVEITSQSDDYRIAMEEATKKYPFKKPENWSMPMQIKASNIKRKRDEYVKERIAELVYNRKPFETKDTYYQYNPKTGGLGLDIKLPGEDSFENYWNQLSPYERSALEGTNYFRKKTKSYWDKIEQGILSLNTVGTPVKNRNYTSDEAAKTTGLEAVEGVFEGPAKITQALANKAGIANIKGVDGEEYGVIDALKGKANNATPAEDLLYDATNYVGPKALISLGRGAAKWGAKNKRALIDHINGAMRIAGSRGSLVNALRPQRTLREQDEAFEFGNQFVDDWVYNTNTGKIRPEFAARVKRVSGGDPIYMEKNLHTSTLGQKKVTDLPRDFLTAYENQGFKFPHKTFDRNVLVSSRRNSPDRDKLSFGADNYVQSKRGEIDGVNFSSSDGQSVTLRDHGFFLNDPPRIEDVATHEGGHTIQRLPVIQPTRFDNPLGRVSEEKDAIMQSILGKNHQPNFVAPWSEFATTWGLGKAKGWFGARPYSIPNTKTPIGRYFSKIMPSKPEKVIGGHRPPWEGSPKELHSEVMVARKNIVGRPIDDTGKFDPIEYENRIQGLQDPSDEVIDQMIKNQNLNRFFLPNVAPETKRRAIREFMPTVVGGLGVYGLIKSGERPVPGLKDGGYVDERPVSEIYETQTGKPWQTAKDEGLTTGSYRDNIALRNRLLQQSSQPVEKKTDYSEYKSFGSAFSKARRSLGKNQTFQYKGQTFTTNLKGEPFENEKIHFGNSSQSKSQSQEPAKKPLPTSYSFKENRIIQGDLMKLGYNIGPTGADGIIGKRTIGAVNKFRKDYNITSNADIEKVIRRTANNTNLLNPSGVQVKLGPTCIEGDEGCSKYVMNLHDASENPFIDRDKAGITADAWLLENRIASMGGQMLYDFYQDKDFSFLKNSPNKVGEIKHIIDKHKNEGIGDYQPMEGDVLGLFYKPSKNHKLAYSRSLGDESSWHKTFHTHAGVIKIKNGVPYVEHRLGPDNVKIEKLSDIINGKGTVKIAQIARPKHLVEESDFQKVINYQRRQEQKLALGKTSASGYYVRMPKHDYVESDLHERESAGEIVDVINEIDMTYTHGVTPEEEEVIKRAVFVAAGGESSFGSNPSATSTGFLWRNGKPEGKVGDDLKDLLGKASRGVYQIQKQTLKRRGIEFNTHDLYDRHKSTEIAMNLFASYLSEIKASPEAKTFDRLKMVDKIRVLYFMHNRGSEDYVKKGGLRDILSRMDVAEGESDNLAIRAMYMDSDETREDLAIRDYLREKKMRASKYDVKDQAEQLIYMSDPLTGAMK